MCLWWLGVADEPPLLLGVALFLYLSSCRSSSSHSGICKSIERYKIIPKTKKIIFRFEVVSGKETLRSKWVFFCQSKDKTELV